MENNARSHDIYNFDAMMRYLILRIEKELSPENADLIKKYDAEMVKQGIAKPTRSKNIWALLTLSKILGKNWSQVTRSDIDDLVYKIMTKFSDESGKETNYTYDLKKAVKLFFRWYKLGSREFKEVGNPPEITGVRMKRVKDKIAREDLLTDSDLTRLLHACGENARDRAFIHCQYEGGTRPGEILSLRIKDAKFDKYGATLHVDGKTGPRTVRLIQSVPDLSSWLKVHPFKENPDAPLWIMLSKNNLGRPLPYTAVKNILRHRCSIAHLEKRVYLNLFRHSEATRSAQFMTEAQMKNRHGWSPYSKMAGRYTHINNADVDEAIFTQYGISKKKEGEYKEKMPKRCELCGTFSSPGAKMCENCIKPLDLQTALEIDVKEQEKNESMKKEFEEFREEVQSELDELKYGPPARGSRYAKALLSNCNTLQGQVLSKLLILLLEVAFPEEKKRAMMKELERAEMENDQAHIWEAMGINVEENKKYLVDLLQRLAKEKPQQGKKGIKPPKLDFARVTEYLAN